MPTLSPTPAITPHTVPAGFRVGPVVELRPLRDETCPGVPGLIELYMSNPALNDVSLTVEAWVEIPSGIQVKADKFAVDTAAGVAHALFEITPGTSKAVHVNIEPIEYRRDREVTIHAFGYYWLGQNRENSYPISLTHPLKIWRECPPHLTPTPTPQPTPTTPTRSIPGFEVISAVVGISIIYLVGRRRK